MENTQTEENKGGWFSDINLRSLGMIVVISLFAGSGGGAGIVGMKGVQAAGGISEEKADVKYLSKSDAERRIESRDKQLESIRKEMMKQEVFDAYQKNNVDRMDRMERMMQQMLENQNRLR